MLDQLAVARRIVEDGEEMMPAWRIETTDGAFLILTRFDTDKPAQRARAMTLIGRFMAWKMATSCRLSSRAPGRHHVTERDAPIASVLCAHRGCSLGT